MEKELARQQKEAEAAAENEAKKKEVDENKTETIGMMVSRFIFVAAFQNVNSFAGVRNNFVKCFSG